MVKVAISPAIAFANGKRVTATHFNVVSIKDNLFDNVLFLYTLLDEHGQWAGESTCELKGREEYQTWDASPEGAYTIVAERVGLEIITPKVGASMF